MKVLGMGGMELIIAMLPALVVGLVCGFVSKSQAAKKGYSEAGFFCLGFFLGVIGLIIALVLPSKQSEATASADSLLKYKELLDQGVISQEEFDAKKRELL